MQTFLGKEIKIGKRYVYLKNEATGSSTKRKLKMIGTCTKLGKNCVFFNREQCHESTYWDKTVKSFGNSIIEDKLLNSSDVICEVE